MSTPSVTQPHETDQQIDEIVALASQLDAADFADLQIFVATRLFVAGQIDAAELQLRVLWFSIVRRVELAA